MLHVGRPQDYPDDYGQWNRLYSVQEWPEEEVIQYDRHIQKTSYNQATITGAVVDWIKSFFPAGYFKRTRITTESAYGEFKSFMRNIYKLEKPFMIIDPQSITHDDESLFGQNMTDRYNFYDPGNEGIGPALIYSLPILKTDSIELVYRRNRFRFDFDMMIMEQNLDRQLNTYNMLLMRIRHNSKFTLDRTLPYLLPSKQMKFIAKVHGYEYGTEEFVRFLNSVSKYSIIMRVTPNGVVLHYMLVPTQLMCEVTGYPNRDTPETSNAIEWGARLTEEFIFKADVPSEFILMIPEKADFVPYEEIIDDTPDLITITNPDYADLDWPTEINGYTAAVKFDVEFQQGDDNKIAILPECYRTIDPDIRNVILECVQKKGKLSDLMLVRAYPNGSYMNAPAVFDDEGILTIGNPQVGKLYTIMVYINLGTINIIREGKNKQHIGTIEKY